jgi:hypothetical protein
MKTKIAIAILLGLMCMGSYDLGMCCISTGPKHQVIHYEEPTPGGGY